MSKANKQIITDILGVEPIMINSALLSAQNRKRLYWFGKLVNGKYKKVEIKQPEDKRIYLKDILESGCTEKLKSYCLDTNYFKGTNLNHYLKKGNRQIVLNDTFLKGNFRKWLLSKGIKTLYTANSEIDLTLQNNKTRANFYRSSHIKGINEKSKCIAANCAITNTSGTGIFVNGIYRRLTPLECERLQIIPDGYTEGVSNSQRYKMIGNAFTCDIIKYILSYMDLK